MFCETCNPEYKNAKGEMVRKDPGRQMTTNFKGTDGKIYHKCTFCGTQELDTEAEQPQESVDPSEHLSLKQQHDRLREAHEKVAVDLAATNQKLATVQAELARAQAKLAAPPAATSDLKPGESNLHAENAAPAVPKELPPAHSSAPGWEKPEKPAA
jgi:hypothetical protein